MLKTSGETGTFGGLMYVILWWRMLKHLRIGVGVEWQNNVYKSKGDAH